jgi:hypothetical protein
MSDVLSNQQAEFGHDQPRVFVLRSGRELAQVPNLIFWSSVKHIRSFSTRTTSSVTIEERPYFQLDNLTLNAGPMHLWNAARRAVHWATFESNRYFNLYEPCKMFACLSSGEGRSAGDGAKRKIRGRWWAHQDLNLEPTDYESAALTVELWARDDD